MPGSGRRFPSSSVAATSSVAGTCSSDSLVQDAMPNTAARRSADRSASCSGVHVHAPALHDGASEEAVGGRRPEQRRHAEPSCGLPEDGDRTRITAKGRDVVTHPSQGSQLILYAPVPDQPVGIGQIPVTQKAQRAEPVVDGHDHGVAVADQLPAPVQEHRPAPRSETTPVYEDHHRAALVRAPPSGDSGNAGVQMLSDRQSSLCGSEAAGSAGLVTPGTATDCGAIGPKVDASRISLHPSASNGGRHRNAPMGARP